ncbi:hypothetical protein IRT45_29635 [Nocardia sp. BSTN01]|uniref:hypothetical protein n=1 Tax=Nocardia sp. BSTN01 TaxID=2783665 RepID=UPI00189090EF|nr:hypothetical protein [Nocardia sp. BSTN01]MBF5001297.1 hypothetical protein [Nocardia sp. BSTN01]
MSGFRVSRGTSQVLPGPALSSGRAWRARTRAGFALAAGTLAGALLPIVGAAPAEATVAPTIAVSMSGSALSPVSGALVGCAQNAVATVRNPDGSPVTHGTVDFFSHLSGISGNIVGTAPVVNGVASIGWMPDRPGEHVVSAVYYDGLPELSPVAGYTIVTTASLGGACV